MKFPCAFKPRCKRPAVWCVQAIGKGGASVCDHHKDEAIAHYSDNGARKCDVWRDAYFEGKNEQQALDLRFGEGEPNSETHFPGK